MEDVGYIIDNFCLLAIEHVKQFTKYEVIRYLV